MPQFTDSVLFLFVRALDPTVMGSVLRFTYLMQGNKGKWFQTPSGILRLAGNVWLSANGQF